ncbi:hypothetical protein FBU30_011207 [Linnemannia zychae]|nr:hypothetical protein FBU30_011207 [Linnemannia zychae]
MFQTSALNTRIGGNAFFLLSLNRTTGRQGSRFPILQLSRGHQQQQQYHLTRTPAANHRLFSTSTQCATAIDKKPLNKKITLPKDPYLLSEKVVKFSKKGKLDDAITLVMEAPKSRQNEVVWNHLIQESSKLGKTNQSWQLLNDMKKRGFEPSDRTFTILLNSLAVGASSSPNSVVRARALYQQMLDSPETKPKTIHTNALLKVCTRQRDYTALQEVYSSMPKYGSNAPDVITYSTIINAYARKGGDEGFEHAWKVWEDLLEAKAKRGEEVDLDTKIVDGILLACREARSAMYIKRGYKLVDDLYGLPASSSPFASSGSGSDSGSGLGSVTERGISPLKSLGLGASTLRKDTIHPRTVELLLSICTKLKDYYRAKHYMTLIRSTFPEFKPDSQLLSSLMHLYTANKEYELAIASWDEIEHLHLPHTPATFKQALDATSKTRNWPKTLEIYTLMRSLISKNKKLDPNQLNRSNTLVQPIVRSQDAWTLVSTLKCAVKTNHLVEGLDILRESRWTRVVQQPQYPRANVDLANLAVKIHSNMMKLTKENLDRAANLSHATATTTNDSLADSNVTDAGEDTINNKKPSRRSESDMERLKRELSDAKAIQTQVIAALENYDTNKAKQKEIEDTNRFQNHPSRTSSYASSSTAISQPYDSLERTSRQHSSFRETNIESDNALTSSDRNQGEERRRAWRVIPTEEYEDSQNNTRYYGKGTKSQKSNMKQDSSKSRRYQQGDGDKTSLAEDAYTLTKQFTRIVE